MLLIPVYVFIGGRIAENSQHVECYSPETDEWRICSSLERPRDRFGVAVVDGKIYAIGGWMFGMP